MSATDKLHRWLDLLAALLRRRYPASFAGLRRDVPGYDLEDVKEDSILRTFERDKDELRELGVAIETLPPDAEGLTTYRLRAADFYLPLLSVCASAWPQQAEVRQVPRRPAGIGFQELPVLLLTPDECLALRRAAARVSGLGHPALADDARSALRKLQFDLADFSAELPAASSRTIDGESFDVLGDALALRKRVRFGYHSIGRDTVGTRTVEPYGLVFLTGHWYLVARDVDADAMRQFRVSRIRDAAMISTKRQHPDYVIPTDFDLSRHAASRQAWELGDGDLVDVTVAFTGTRGAVTQGASLGEPEDGDAGDVRGEPSGTDDAAPAEIRRRFRVRRPDPFLRWLLSFAGDARPLAPASMVESWRQLLRETQAAYAAVSAVDLPTETSV
jgi:predicted DNA-binding transcriptional regulator YafY